MPKESTTAGATIESAVEEAYNVQTVPKQQKKERISTALSRYTKTQNTDLVNKEIHLFKPDTAHNVEHDQQIKRRMNDKLTKTRQGLRLAKFNIKTILDTGDLHHVLHPNHIVKVEMQQDIPRCFKINLSEFGSPLIV